MEQCLEHARRKQNLSVDRVADRMGVSSRYSVYKWMENSRLPAVLIRPFELATGADYVTEYLALSAHKLVLDMPSGRKATGRDIAHLHESFAEAVTALAGFYAGHTDAHTTLATLAVHMQVVAFHHGNVQRFEQPELGLCDAEESEA